MGAFISMGLAGGKGREVDNSGKLRHGPPINYLKSEGGWSISEHFGSRSLKLCQIHILTSCVNLVFFNYVNVVT